MGLDLVLADDGPLTDTAREAWISCRGAQVEHAEEMERPTSKEAKMDSEALNEIIEQIESHPDNLRAVFRRLAITVAERWPVDRTIVSDDGKPVAFFGSTDEIYHRPPPRGAHERPRLRVQPRWRYWIVARSEVGTKFSSDGWGFMVGPFRSGTR